MSCLSNCGNMEAIKRRMCVLCIIKWWAMDEYISTQRGTASLQCRSARILKITSWMLSDKISFSSSHLHCLLFTLIFKCVDRIVLFLLCPSKLTINPLFFFFCIHVCYISLPLLCRMLWNISVVLAVPSRLFVRSLVWQPWLWITSNICSPSSTEG